MDIGADTSDQELLKSFGQHGSEAAFSLLAQRHQSLMYSAAYRICGNHSDAQDVLQKGLTVLAKKAPQLDDVKSLAAWLHRVVTLESKKVVHKRTLREKRETMASQRNEINAEGESMIEKVSPILDDSLNSLGEHDRRVITMHYLEGLTFKAIAQTLGGSSEAYRKRCSRALEKLGQKLKHKGVTISAVALGSVLTSTSAKAGVSQIILDKLTDTALSNVGHAATTTGTALTGSLLLSMKTGIAISLAIGALLSLGWNNYSKSSASTHQSLSVNDQGSGLRSKHNPPPSSSRPTAFSMETLRHAISHFDGAAESDPYVETRLRSLMFTIPEKHLEEALQLLLNTKNTQRFSAISTALFARWAELNPEQALAQSNDAGPFNEQARRGALITWLNQDHAAAIDAIIDKKSTTDLRHLNDFMNYKAERLPEEAAATADYLRPLWPATDGKFLWLVAKLWSTKDAKATGEWVASHPDIKTRQPLLRYLAGTVAKLRGFEGLDIANRIQNPAKREDARNHAIYWWGITMGGVSVQPDKVRPYRDLSKGFPDDWTDKNISTFSFTYMVNYSKYLDDLVLIAKDDKQRQLIHQGAVEGVGWSNPAAATLSVEALDDGFVQSQQGKRILRTFFERWQALDSGAAKAWLKTIPDGPKKEVMTSKK